MATHYQYADATVSAHAAKAVTLNDSTVIPVTRAVFVGTGGHLKVTMVSGDVVTFKNIPSGTVLPIQITSAWAAVTSAADVVALY